MAVTILAVADGISPLLYDHFDAERWKAIDLVLSSGDLPPEYLDFLCTALHVPVLYVRGNHDASFELARYDGFENLHGRIYQYKGLRIAGFEGSQRYSGGSCQYTEAEMARAVRRVQREAKRVGAPHIVLTHAPPAGIHDSEDVCHRGFTCFREAIDLWNPVYFVHGHMHNYTGGPVISTVGTTDVINSYLYRVFQAPAVEPASVLSRRRLRSPFHVPLRRPV
jgi:hypothetical protein